MDLLHHGLQPPQLRGHVIQVVLLRYGVPVLPCQRSDKLICGLTQGIVRKSIVQPDVCVKRAAWCRAAGDENGRAVYAFTVKSDLMAKLVRTVAATPVFQSSLIFACCAVLTSAYDKSNAHCVIRIVLSLPQHAVTAVMGGSCW